MYDTGRSWPHFSGAELHLHVCACTCEAWHPCGKHACRSEQCVSAGSAVPKASADVPRPSSQQSPPKSAAAAPAAVRQPERDQQSGARPQAQQQPCSSAPAAVHWSQNSARSCPIRLQILPLQVPQQQPEASSAAQPPVQQQKQFASQLPSGSVGPAALQWSQNSTRTIPIRLSIRDRAGQVAQQQAQPAQLQNSPAEHCSAATPADAAASQHRAGGCQNGAAAGTDQPAAGSTLADADMADAQPPQADGDAAGRSADGDNPSIPDSEPAEAPLPESAPRKHAERSIPIVRARQLAVSPSHPEPTNSQVQVRSSCPPVICSQLALVQAGRPYAA